jgi:hypothetical protein
MAPEPSGNAAVRGTASRPSPRPQRVRTEAERRETDEWTLLGRFLRWGVAAVTLAIVVVAIFAFMGAQ